MYSCTHIHHHKIQAISRRNQKKVTGLSFIQDVPAEFGGREHQHRVMEVRDEKYVVHKQPILIICGFLVFKFTCLLKLICKPKINTCGPFSHPQTHTEKQKTCPPTHMFPAEVEKGDILPPCFSCHNVNKCPFCSLFSTTFFTGLFSALAICPLKMTPKCSVEVLVV